MIWTPRKRSLFLPPRYRRGGFAFSPADCDCCCTPCRSGIFPDEIDVELGDFASGHGCPTCANANGTWTLAQQIEPFEVEGVNCQVWYSQLFESTPFCVFGGALPAYFLAIQLKIFYFPSTGFRRVILDVMTGGINDHIVAEFSFEEEENPFDCSDFQQLDVPFTGGAYYGGFPVLCTAGPPTCTLSP